jgi:hypothetical protein
VGLVFLAADDLQCWSGRDRPGFVPVLLPHLTKNEPREREGQHEATGNAAGASA